MTGMTLPFVVNILKEKGHRFIKTADGAAVVGRKSRRRTLIGLTKTRARGRAVVRRGLAIFPRADDAAKPFDENTSENSAGACTRKVLRFEAGRFLD